MKVCHIIAGLTVGGAERMLQRLVQGHRAGFAGEHVVISLTGIGPIGAELAASGVLVRAVGMVSARRLPAGLWQLYRLIRSERPDVVQTWMYHGDLFGGLAARLAGVRSIIWGVRTTHVVGDRGGSARHLLRMCARASSWLPSSIVCAAHVSSERHVKLGYAADKMAVVPNGFVVCATDQLARVRAAVRHELGWADTDLVVGVVARYNIAKDIPNFIAAARKVAESHPAARFVLIGAGMDSTNLALSELLRQSGVAHRFQLLSERNDVRRYLAALDIYCLSSKTEAFPNVVGEAMAESVPCVVTDVGDAALLVGDTGIVVPKEDAAALAAGLLRLAQMPHEARAALGHRARQRIESHFSMDEAVRKFDAIYRAAIARTIRD